MALKGHWLVYVTWLVTMFTSVAANHMTQATPCTAGDTFPHPSGDCNKYLICASGSLQDQNCITGLNFEPNSHGCVWPHEYACPTTTTATTNMAPYTGTVTTSSPTTTTCTHGQKYVHPSGDCNRYLSCANGILLEQSCGAGLVFHPDGNSCVWPSDYTCPTTTTTTTTTAPYTGTGSTTTRTVTPTTPGVTSTTTCTHGQSYVHPSGNCTRYLTCTNGMLLETSCPAGLTFSPIDGTCVWIYQYACPTTTATSTKMAPYAGTETPTTSTTTCKHGQNYVHPSGNCTRYLTCSDGILLEHSCTEGLNYSPDVSDCVWPRQYACPTTTSSTTKAISYTETGTAATTTTSPYTRTDTKPTTTTTTTAPYTGTDSTTPRTVTPTTSGDTSTTTCTRGGQNYVHPYGDCNRYLTCSNGMILEKSCSTGLIFNPYENICVLPSQYACLMITTPTTSSGAHFQHSLGLFTLLLFCLLFCT